MSQDVYVGAEMTSDERLTIAERCARLRRMYDGVGLNRGDIRILIEMEVPALLAREEQLTVALRKAAERFDFIAERLPGAAAYAIDARFALGEDPGVER